MMSNGSDQVLEAMGPEILFFFFALFSATDVNVLSQGWGLIQHSQMDFLVLYDLLLFMSYNDDQGLFFFNCIRRSGIAGNLSLIMNSPFSCTKANNKAEHSNHWEHRNTPMQAQTQTQAQGQTKGHIIHLEFHECMSEWVGEWVRRHNFYVTGFHYRLVSWLKEKRSNAGVKFNKKCNQKCGRQAWRVEWARGGSDNRWQSKPWSRGSGENSFWRQVRGGTPAVAAAQRPRQPRQNAAALTHVTYGFGSGRDVLDDHLALGAQVLLAQRRFAILVQVHVLLHTRTHTGENEHMRDVSHRGKVVSFNFSAANLPTSQNMKGKFWVVLFVAQHTITLQSCAWFWEHNKEVEHLEQSTTKLFPRWPPPYKSHPWYSINWWGLVRVPSSKHETKKAIQALAWS